MEHSEIITTLMYTGLQVHIFHLQTRDYAKHQALGDLYSAIQSSTDSLAEALIGLDKGERPKLATTIDLVDYTPNACHPLVEEFIAWLESIDGLPTDILNMRDDLLSTARKTRYMLSLDGEGEEYEEEEAGEAEAEPEATSEPMAGETPAE